MKVTSKMTLEEYDQFCKTFVPKKKPDWRNRDYRMRMGDCIYNYSSGPETRKCGQASTRKKIMEKDLSGLYALVSKQFYYFGNQPVKLPDDLRPIMHTTQGHKSDANQEYVESIRKLDRKPGYCPQQSHRRTATQETILARKRTSIPLLHARRWKKMNNIHHLQ